MLESNKHERHQHKPKSSHSQPVPRTSHMCIILIPILSKRRGVCSYMYFLRFVFWVSDPKIVLKFAPFKIKTP